MITRQHTDFSFFSFSFFFLDTMFYGDRYDPNLLDDDDHSFVESQPDVLVQETYEIIPKKTKRHNENRNRKTVTETKVSEEGYCCIHSNKKTPTGSKIYIEYYHTKLTPGSLIRNAMTGGYEYGNRVGSANEDLFFKVNRAVGDFKNVDPHILYYNSPEQYERHFMTVLPVGVKERWLEKNVSARFQHQSQ
jgi:hypothetical protein